MPELNLGFKYKIDQHVTRTGDVQPSRQPVVPRYTVVSSSWKRDQMARNTFIISAAKSST